MENKINIACFKEGSRTAEVRGIWQWDYGQILRIQGLNLPSAVEIHFSLDEHGGEAARRIGITKDGVTDVPIPDLMVENESAYGDSYYFFAYIYLTDETSGNTEYKIRAKVSTRSKPEGYVSGGNDTFAEILKTVNEIADDKVTRPLIAKVGQVLSVKATDESGKPTEFEATDQGGGVSDEKIAEAVGTYMEAHPIEESDPTVPQWAKQSEKPTYTALEVGADASGTAVAKVSEHNTASNAHNDIRLLVQGLTTRLNALADSDDTTLDQMSEVVAYIKLNKSLIDAITTSKVNVSDIIDNLVTNVSNKPLSAAQGVALKALIDAIVVPTKLSELENDSGYAKTTDIPDKLPNPQKLTFAGAITAEYDGSGAVTVTIPESSGGSGGTGMTTEVKTLMLSLFKAAVYNNPEMQVTVDALEQKWTGSGSSGGEETVYYIITNNLTNVSNSNSDGAVAENTSYSATLTVNDGYEMESVTVTMGGSDITATAYANGVVTIENVTGNVVITANATATQEARTVYFASDESITKTNGAMATTGSINLTSNVRYKVATLPYSDGMKIHTYMMGSSITSYPPFILYDGTTYTVPEYETVESNTYEITLSGLSNPTVYVNMLGTTQGVFADDRFYYVTQ